MRHLNRLPVDVVGALQREVVCARGIGHQLGDLCHAANIFHAVGLGKAQIAIEAVTDIVAI